MIEFLSNYWPYIATYLTGFILVAVIIFKSKNSYNRVECDSVPIAIFWPLILPIVLLIGIPCVLFFGTGCILRRLGWIY